MLDEKEVKAADAFVGGDAFVLADVDDGVTFVFVVVVVARRSRRRARAHVRDVKIGSRDFVLAQPEGRDSTGD